MARQTEDLAIQSTLAGGLALNVTPNSTEFTHASYLLNALPLESGGLRKRSGTRVMFAENERHEGVTGVSLRTQSNLEFLVTKEYTSLAVYVSTGQSLNRAVVKQNVWNAASGPEKAYTVTNASTDPRVLFFVPNANPVQLSFVEARKDAVSGDVVFDEAEPFNGLGVSSVILFQDGNVVSEGFSIAYNGSTRQVTVSGLSAWAGTSTFVLVGVTWQWWAEGLNWFGNRFYATAPKFANDAEDAILAVPESVRTDLDLDITTNPDYPIRVYQSNTYADAFTYDAANTPTGTTEYAFSDGTVGVSPTNPTPFFVAFGTQAAGTAHFLRRRELRFRDGVGVSGANLRVYVNGVLTSQNITGAASTATGDYYLYDSAQTLITDTSTTASYLSFEATNPIGIPALALVDIVNVDRTWVGSAALATKWVREGTNADGTFIIAPGLSFFADSLRGKFPSFAVIYDERLILGGFAHRPLTLALSAKADTRTPGEFFTFFQISDEATLDTDPFDLVISGKANEKIVSVLEWQENLFMLSNVSAYRIAGSPFTATNVGVAAMAEVGAVSRFSTVVTEIGVFYIAPRGLYTITSRDNITNNYDAESRSVLVEPIFDVFQDRTTWDKAWLVYDARQRHLFVALPEKHLNVSYAYRMFVYSLPLDAWTEYYAYGGFRSYDGVFVFNRVFALGSTFSDINGNATNYLIYHFDFDWVDLDFVDYSATTSGTIYTVASPVGVRHTTVAGLQEYAYEPDKTGLVHGFRVTPFTDYEDIRVRLNGVTLTFGKFPGEGDFNKLPNGNVYLNADPGAGLLLEIVPIR